ncbi:MAG: DNA mismatch repair endonuclease MutL [Candidatus Kapabacteria bacterium]|nr:DNA mismatch repair endonuclease MutL [Candidatus Kapabacteria bacterium]
MQKIKILPDVVANQIAAGEVVQRPESVIKELIENSLDAGSDSIFVVVKGAGKQLIHIVDNGFGMSKEDLLLSVRRHATSKIYSSDDLERIITYGFRGEALASIAAVSQLEIRTRQKEDEMGWKLLSEPSKELIIEPCITEIGTQIFVKNLFYNVPARRKFLKSNLTEFRYISDTMIKFALSKPEIRFTFYDEDTLIFDLKPSDLINRIKDLWGENTSSSLLPVYLENEYIKINGFIGKPHLVKQSKSGQYIFLNGRSIINKSISHAIFSAYEHLLEKSGNPFYIIFIELNPESFDVNVHPQKNEVKFEDERMIYGFMNKAVSKTLQENNLAPEYHFINQQVSQPFGKIDNNQVSPDKDYLIVNKLTGEIIEKTQTNSLNSTFPQSHYYPRQQFNHREQAFTSAFDKIFGNSPNEDKSNIDIFKTETGESSESSNISYWQLHNKYILTQTANGLTIIDQHAAHERILYEKALKAMNREFSYSQQLLFPVTVKVTPTEMKLIEELKTELNSLGFVFDFLSVDKIEITSVPLDTINGEEINSFREIIETYDEYQKVRHTNKRDNLAASYSCKSAIKTGQKLSVEEMKNLITELQKCEVPYACPHGRPIIIEFTLDFLDRKFGRIL